MKIRLTNRKNQKTRVFLTEKEGHRGRVHHQNEYESSIPS